MDNQYSKHDDFYEPDSDSDIEDDNEVAPSLRKLRAFIDKPEYKTKKKSKDLSLWEQGGKFGLYALRTDNDIKRFFSLYNRCVSDGVVLHFTEYQTYESSGLRLDFDIYQESKDSKLDDHDVRTFLRGLGKILQKVFEIPDRFEAFAIVTQKPVVKFDIKKNKWKDGIHIDIPSIKARRPAKKYIISLIQQSGLVQKAFSNYPDAFEFLDTMSASVPLVLYGSCKKESVPYKIWQVYKIQFDAGSSEPYLAQDLDFAKAKINIALEMSANWEGSVITKVHLKEHPTAINEIEKLTMPTTDETTREQKEEIIGEMNVLTATDPEAMFLKEALNILKPQRYNNRRLWFKVMYALVRNRPHLIPLARWFSAKSLKYDESGFQKCVSEVQNGKDYTLNKDTLFYWARIDNPEAYEKIKDLSCEKKIIDWFYNPIISGRIGQTHFAELVNICLSNKFRTDFQENSKNRLWYEFKFAGDKYNHGEVYKWVQVQSPDTIDAYLRGSIFKLCERMSNKFIQKLERETDDKKKKDFKVRINAFKSSVRMLTQYGWKEGIIKQLEKTFYTPGFIKQLDQNAMALGVGNGILLLSRDGSLPQLIQSYNSLGISRYTGTSYRQFDPKDPLTRKILKSLRSMHRDDETDVFEYLMAMKAASIDNRPREAILVIIVGQGSNGKSSSFEMHQAALGDKYCANMPITILLVSKEDSGEAPKPFMMRLETARAAYYEEGPAAAALYMPIIKRITGCATLAVRGLYEGSRNVQSKCYHFLLSNHDFTVTSHEDAVWRRLRYIDIGIQFKNKYDFVKGNPLHRPQDPEIDSDFAKRPDVRERYLSIMVYYHMKLMKYFGGVIENVPHPTIDRFTREFRNRQDTLNRFISERIVTSPTKDTTTPVSDITDSYITWYDKNIGGKTRHYKQDISKQILDSALGRVIDHTPYGDYLKSGYRVLGLGEIPGESEVIFVEPKKSKGSEKNYETKFGSETPDEYLDRVEREWGDLLKWNTERNTNISNENTQMSALEVLEEDLLLDDDDLEVEPPKGYREYEQKGTTYDETDDYMDRAASNVRDSELLGRESDSESDSESVDSDKKVKSKKTKVKESVAKGQIDTQQLMDSVLDIL